MKLLLAAAAAIAFALGANANPTPCQPESEYGTCNTFNCLYNNQFNGCNYGTCETPGASCRIDVGCGGTQVYCPAGA
jgi:hypothetical protein